MSYEQQSDVVYGYKDGMGLLMDVYTPAKQNGAAIVLAVSGGWSTRLEWRHDVIEIDEDRAVLMRALVEAGYTIFAAAHGTQPRYNLEELRSDLPRAVRFIRYHAGRFGVDGDRIGIVGASSGGHVSLMTGLAPPSPDRDADDPVDRESSEVQAVVAYCPPTDLLNYGASGKVMDEEHRPKRNAAFDFRRFDESSNRYERITDPAEREDLVRQNSPVTHVKADSPPVLLIHGNADELVPFQQSEVLRDRLAAVGATHELIVLEGLGHQWPPAGMAQAEAVAWFDRYLAAGGVPAT